MSGLTLLTLREQPARISKAAAWFHEKWGISAAVYQESMEQCTAHPAAIPQWYLALEDDHIVGGLGVIANDFHPRRDLTPNVCAVYVEKHCRRRGIAAALLHFACADMREIGIDTLYLLTDHTSFYERCGWEFLCMVQGEGDSYLSRMYVHRFT